MSEDLDPSATVPPPRDRRSGKPATVSFGAVHTIHAFYEPQSRFALTSAAVPPVKLSPTGPSPARSSKSRSTATTGFKSSTGFQTAPSIPEDSEWAAAATPAIPEPRSPRAGHRAPLKVSQQRYEGVPKVRGGGGGDHPTASLRPTTSSDEASPSSTPPGSSRSLLSRRANASSTTHLPPPPDDLDAPSRGSSSTSRDEQLSRHSSADPAPESPGWQSSDADISALSDRELARLQKKGINPALYLEMKAARRKGPRWIGPLAGNTFLS